MSFLIASNNYTEDSTIISLIKTERPAFHKQKNMLPVKLQTERPQFH